MLWREADRGVRLQLDVGALGEGGAADGHHSAFLHQEVLHHLRRTSSHKWYINSAVAQSALPPLCGQQNLMYLGSDRLHVEERACEALC